MDASNVVAHLAYDFDAVSSVSPCLNEVAVYRAWPCGDVMPPLTFEESSFSFVLSNRHFSSRTPPSARLCPGRIRCLMFLSGLPKGHKTRGALTNSVCDGEFGTDIGGCHIGGVWGSWKVAIWLEATAFGCRRFGSVAATRGADLA